MARCYFSAAPANEGGLRRCQLCLGSLTGLTSFNLCGDGLKELPAWLGSLTGLVYLQLGRQSTPPYVWADGASSWWANGCVQPRALVGQRQQLCLPERSWLAYAMSTSRSQTQEPASMPAVCPISQGVCRLGRLGRGRRYSRQRILAEAEAASRQTPSVRLLCSRDCTLLWNGHPLWTQACVGGSLVDPRPT